MRNNVTNRVLIPGDGRNNRAIASAMKLGLELSRKVANDIEGVVLYFPNKKSIRNSCLKTVVSPKIARLLHDGRHIPMGAGSELRLRAETLKTFKNGSHRDIVIAIGADAKMMAKVDKIADLHTVIAVPQNKGSLDSWAETWSPLIPGEKKKEAEKMLKDPIITKALTALAVGIDFSQPGLAIQDRKQVENMVRLLRQNNRYEEPEILRDWALSNGWHTRTVDELVGIWEKTFDLKNTTMIQNAA